MTSHEHNSNHESDSFATLVREAVAGEALSPSDPTLREALLKRLDQPVVEPALKVSMADRRRTFFQRAGIALASTAALALVGVIWQRPALERVIGMNSSAAVKRALPVLDRFGSTIPDNRKAMVRTGPQSSMSSPEQVQLGSGSSRAVYDPAIQEINPGFPNEGVAVDSTSHSGVRGTEQRWEDRVADSSGGQGRADRRPVGEPAPTPAPRPAVATAAPPASQPAGPALPGEGQPTSGKPASFSERDEGLLNQLYVIPSPDSNSPARRRPAKPGEPGHKYREQLDKPTDEKLAREVVRLETYQKSITAIETPSVSSATTSPAKGPDSRGGVNKAEGRVEAEKKLSLAKLNEGFQNTEARTKNELDIRRAKELQDLEAQDFFRQRALAAVTGEQYAKIVENEFLNPRNAEQALSTFSIDVDTASYANVRRFLTNGQLPPPDAVRLEELVNYFKYKYPQPKGDDPFSVSTEMADCPWQPGHKLLRVGVQGKEIHRAERPASNIVFLIDTSGSMTDENKLPLLKQAFTMLVGELNENDKVTIVTYAGNAGLRLPPTRGHEKETIIAAIEGMQSGGSTHGSAGISLAYEVAAAQFIKGGTNKVILATDGDLNVGITDDAALVELITKKAETGVFLTVLGVGTGNLKDAKMERLADNGNGIYAYLDSVREARKVLVEEMSGSLVTIAQDVKIQVEFNENQVHSYRLLGYENRVMANEHFRDDAKDAGEIGAGHTVTAMYEVVLVGAEKKEAEPKVEVQPAEQRLRYKKFVPGKTEATEAGKSDELLTVRLRYKKPEAKKEDAAKELEFPLKDKGGSFNSASKEFQFASAVVAFGLSLRQSEYRGSANFSAVAEIAAAGLGEDVGGHRAEFLDLARRAKTLRGE